MLSVVTDGRARAELATDRDELVREGARRLLVPDGQAPARTLTTAAGQVEVVRPRIDDRRVDPGTGQRVQFQSVILPRWCRRSPEVAAVLPLLYLHGLSSMDLVPALEGFFGAAAGLSASVITRLAAQWQAERQAFAQRDLHDRDYVYWWAEGIHFDLRLEDGRLCWLVIVGVRADGTKELVAVADGERESTDAWVEMLRDLRRRGMRAPVAMVGDGALGLWAAPPEVVPTTAEQRWWVHKLRNVLGALPKSVHAGARRTLNEIIEAEDRAHAERAIQALLCLFDYPGQHWLRLRAANLIESSFSPVRARTRVTKGPGNKDAGLAMVFKLVERAEPDQQHQKAAA